MNRRRPIAVFLACCLAFLTAGAVAQEHQHQHSESLGNVNFAVTCTPGARAAFSRAVAMLYSFGYEEARNAFADIAREDPACGMAHWGVAMSYYHPIWAPPSPTELEAGRAAAEAAASAGAPNERERRYISAIGAFYLDPKAPDHRARAVAYKTAMEGLAADFPADADAQVFFALSLLGTAPPNDPTFASQKQAAGILNKLLPSYPDHPGILHYLIHSFDYPQVATLALDAARSYAKAAPSSPHALHMPSHIFTRLGLWDECIASNLASSAAARAQVAKSHPGRVSFDDLHALDYLAYAYLQIGDDARALEVLAQVKAAKRFDDPSFAAGYALAAVPARLALERRDWPTAAALELPVAELPWDRMAYALGITHFANAIGAARAGKTPEARAAVGRLEALHGELAQAPPAGPYDWAGQIESMRLAAAGWTALAEGHADDAVRLLEEATETERRVGKHPVTPGAILPAAELLGDALLELKRPKDALAAYETSLADAPNRFNSLAGAARAAELAGNRESARRFSEELLAVCQAPCERPEAKRAAAFLESR